MARVFGLDLLRAIAVLMVLSSHALFFVRPLVPAVQALSLFGFLGVELFFVLSGFLVGGIALRSFGARPGTTDLFGFWVRRWFRTLPNYYLFLGVNLAIAARVARPSGVAPYLVFLQNFAWTTPWFFPESWSLAVEEWFYLLFPLLVVALSRAGASRRAAVAFGLAALFIGSSGARGWAVAAGNPSWDEGVRKIVIYRLDALMVGVVAAFLKEYHRPSWSRYRDAGVALGTILATSVCWLYYTLDRNGSDFARTGFFTLTSFSVFCFLPALDAWQDAGGVVATVARKISLWSYSLYLCHLPVRNLLIGAFGDPELVKPAPSPGFAVGMTIGFVSLSIAASALVYHFFERPTMALREKFSTSHPVSPS